MKKILVFGSNGLVGSSLQTVAKNNNYKNYLFEFSTRSDTNLFSYKETFHKINSIKPDIIINSAGKVGGINDSWFNYENLYSNNGYSGYCYLEFQAIKKDSIKAYADSFFEERRNIEDLLPAIQKRDTTAAGYDILNQGKELSEAYIYQRDISAFDIQQYRVKGVWYFDKRRSELRYRILGIAPVAPDVNFIDEIDAQNNEDYLVELFWIWYEDARPLLAATPSFNELNSNFPLSFDRILTARMFKAKIYQTENELDDIESLNEEFIFPDFNLMPDEIIIDTIERESILKKLPFFKKNNEATDSIVQEKQSIKQRLKGLFKKRKVESTSEDSTKQQ